jgi:hypothetical protein
MMRAPIGARTALRAATRLAFVGSLMLAVSVAGADTLFQTWTAYEIREEINCNPGGSTDPLCLAETTQGFGTRIADAMLVGGDAFGLLGGIYSPAGQLLGGVSISASSILSQVDWTGPAHGKFTTVLDTGVTQTGTLSGQLDLSGVRFNRIPVAPISGRWAGTRGTLKATGTFAGSFLLPVECSEAAFGWCYLDPEQGLVALQAKEMSGGVPLIKLTVSLFIR